MPKQLSREQYLTLRNTARILRGSGVSLSPAQVDDLKKWERAVALYERAEGITADA